MAGTGTRTTDTARVEAFSDGVIAIALTLLVLDLITAHEPRHFGSELLEQWPSYLAYLAAFLTIASIWLSHHDAFSRLARADVPVRVLNLALLLGIALVPWPTALFAASLGEAHTTLGDRRAAVVVYVVVSLIVAAGWSGLSAVVLRRPELVGDPADVGWFRSNLRFSAAGGTISVAAGVLGWFVPVAALAVFLLVPCGFFAATLAAARR